MKKMQDTQKKVAALGKEAEEKIAGMLTDDQKKSWKAMIGEKFDTSKLQPGFGGFGGFGGGERRRPQEQ
jgi:hypothetical protein